MPANTQSNHTVTPIKYYLNDKDYAVQKRLKTAYFSKIGYKPHEKQELFHDSRARFRLANCGRRFGKAEYIENLIPMFNGGYKKMADIVIGDKVIGPDGNATTVVNTTDIMYGQDCAKVMFNDYTERVVAKSHLWTVVDKKARKALTEPTRRIYYEPTLTTEEMQRTIKVGKESNYAINLAKPIQYVKRELKVDPYLLGIWLGDGAKNGTIITTADNETLVELDKLGLEYKKYSEYGYYVYGLRNLLKAYYEFDYIDEARNTQALVGDKFVPEDYLYSNVEDRLALLQGLMDTDGTISKHGHCEFSTTTPELVDAVYQLVISLGMKCVIYNRVTQYTSNGKRLYGKKSYRVCFKPTIPVFRLTRKLDRINYEPVKYKFITDIIDVPSVPVKCITVDREDGLYLTGSYTITHNSLMVAKDLQPKLLLPNKRYWIVGPTYDLAEKEFRVIWQDMIIKLGLGRDKTVKKSYSKKQGNMTIEFSDRNTILEVRSADHPENLVGEALDGVIISEAAKHKKDTWEQYIRPALADKNGFADFATTPEGFNWYYDEWMHGKDPIFAGTYESWMFPSWENSVIFPDGKDNEEIQLLIKTMNKDSFDQEIGANFGSFSGKIYAEWNIEENVIKSSTPYRFNPLWPNYIAFDFGYTNPLAAIEFQISPDDKIYIWREHYMSYTRLEEHIRIIKEREQPDGYHINLCFGDAADPEAVDYISTHFAPCMADPKAKVNWRDGIDLVKGFLNREIGEDECGGPIYGPALLVTANCINTIKEFNNYRSPNAINGKNVQEIGLKQDDHAMDAIRYALVHIYQLGATTGLADVMGDLNTVASVQQSTINTLPQNAMTPTSASNRRNKMLQQALQAVGSHAASDADLGLQSSNVISIMSSLVGSETGVTQVSRQPDLRRLPGTTTFDLSQETSPGFFTQNKEF